MYPVLFSKKEQETVLMDFRFAEPDGLPAIQAYGEVDGQMYYCNAYYSIRTRDYAMWEDGRYQRIADSLRAASGRVRIEVVLIRKNGSPADFRIDTERLAKTLCAPDIRALELARWGLFDSETEL